MFTRSLRSILLSTSASRSKWQPRTYSISRKLKYRFATTCTDGSPRMLEFSVTRITPFQRRGDSMNCGCPLAVMKLRCCTKNTEGFGSLSSSCRGTTPRSTSSITFGEWNSHRIFLRSQAGSQIGRNPRNLFCRNGRGHEGLAIQYRKNGGNEFCPGRVFHDKAHGSGFQRLARKRWFCKHGGKDEFHV